MPARQTPVGVRLDDGYRTLIAFELAPDVALWEKTVKPFGIDGGDSIETSTMFNLVWRTMHGRALKTLTPATFTAAYDPAVYDQILDLINENGLLTIWFPDGTEVDIYGYLRLFEPPEHQIGEQPVATCTIVATNVNPSTGEETGPVIRTMELDFDVDVESGEVPLDVEFTYTGES